jgi:hypothetical protein
MVLVLSYIPFILAINFRRLVLDSSEPRSSGRATTVTRDKPPRRPRARAGPAAPRRSRSPGPPAPRPRRQYLKRPPGVLYAAAGCSLALPGSVSRALAAAAVAALVLGFRI